MAEEGLLALFQFNSQLSDANMSPWTLMDFLCCTECERFLQGNIHSCSRVLEEIQHDRTRAFTFKENELRSSTRKYWTKEGLPRSHKTQRVSTLPLGSMTEIEAGWGNEEEVSRKKQLAFLISWFNLLHISLHIKGDPIINYHEVETMTGHIYLYYYWKPWRDITATAAEEL